MANRIHFNALFTAVFLLSCLSLKADEEQKARRIGVIFEGSFENHPISRNPSGAESTQMVPFYEWDYGVRAFSEEEWAKRDLSWDRILEITRSLGDKMVESVEPGFVRDERGVVLYAIFADEDPFLTTAVFSENFRKVFEEKMGKSLYLVIADRECIYVFPSVGGALEEFGPGLVNEFRTTSLPVSLEVFFLNDEGLRVIGELSRDGAP